MVPILSIVVIVLSIILFLQHQKHKTLINNLEEEFSRERVKIRKDAAFKSSAINWGMTIENFVPFMDKFPVPPESAIFMGKPIDFVSFTDTDDPEKCAVHIIEVKSGKSQLLKHQRHIRDAIKNGKIHWHEIRVDSNPKK